MASLPTPDPPGLPPLDVEDPWDWSVDQVAQNLCDPSSSWLTSFDPLSRPDPVALNKVLRSEGVSGPILLTQIDHANLREDLGIKALGSRGTVVLWIRHLRNQSRKYSDYVLEDAANTPLPSIGRASSGWPDSQAASPFYQTPLYRPNRALSALPTMFYSPTSSTEHMQAINGLSTTSIENKIQGSLPNQVPANTLPEGPKLDTFRGQSPRLQDTKGTSDERGTSISQCPNDDGLASTLDGHHTRSVVLGDSNEPPAHIFLHARTGETYITDSNGRKRRKLILGAPLHQSENAKDTATTSGNSTTDRSQIAIIDHNMLAEDPPPQDFIEGPGDLDFVERPQRTMLLNSSVLPMIDRPLSLSIGEQIDAISTKGTEDGEVMVPHKHGQKALGPTQISTVCGAVNVQYPWGITSPLSTDEGEESLLMPPNKAKDIGIPEYAQADTRCPRKMEHVYMGCTSFPVDNIFYGSTHIRQELAVNTSEHIDLQQESERHYDQDKFMFDSTGYFGTGRRLYVHSRLKHFLRRSEQKIMEHADRQVVKIEPYPNYIIKKKGQVLSVTKFVESPHGVVVSRERRHGELNLDNNLAFEGLEKYNYLEGGEAVLPAYGDSDSESGYDSDFFQEMENDEKRKAKPIGIAKGGPLSTEVVVAAVEEATKAIITHWETKQLTSLRRKSWRIWKKACRDRSNSNQILSLVSKVEILDNRLTKMKDHMLAEPWHKVKHVKRQCKSMEPTLFDREACKWEISILESSVMPDRPPASERKTKPHELPDSPTTFTHNESVSTSASDSETSDEDMDGFIDDEDVEGESECSGLAVADMDEAASPTDVEGGKHDSNHASSSPHTKVRNPSVPSDAQQTGSSLDQSYIGVEIGLNVIKDNGNDISSLPPIKDERLSKDTNGLRAVRTMLLTGKKGKPLTPEKSIVDLTLSDPVRPSTPVTSQVSPRIKTPPIDLSDDEPFRRVRSAKATFKDPFEIQSSDIIDLESDSLGSELEEVQSIYGSERLPAFDDILGIMELGSETWIERNDRMRLLIWRIEMTPDSSRRSAFIRMNAASFEVNEHAIQAGLKAMLRSAQKLRGEDAEQSNAIMTLAAWYICWTVCVVPKEAEGVNKKHVQTTIDDEEGFAPYWDFLKECRKHYKDALPKKTASVGLNSKTVTPSNRKIESDADDVLSSSFTTPSKNRKKLVKQSQEALSLQKNAMQRVRDKEAQQVKLKARLKKMGLNEDDGSKKVINVGNSDDGDLIFLHPDIGSRIKAHQLDGVRFMWREIITNDQKPEGCLLAQTMGLGKTMQVISLLVTIAEAAHSSNANISKQIPERLRDCRTLILCPVGLIDNWVEEFLLWQPQPKVANLGEIRAVLSSLQFDDRLCEIREWREHGGILLLGYTTFRALLANKVKKDGQRPLSEIDLEKLEETLLEYPSIVVADEAHTIKNESSSFYKALSRVKTRSRIALTGSPLSNNLEEYYTIIDWVARGFLGDKVEFRAHYIEPIKEGSFQESSKEEVKKSRQMLHVLNSRLEPKMHRADMSTIRSQLKGKTEFVIILPLTSMQKTAYKAYVNAMNPTNVESQDKEPGTATLWAWIAILRLLVNHPKCFLDKLNAPQAEKARKSNQPNVRSKMAAEDSDAIDQEVHRLLEAPVTQLGISEKLISRQKAIFEDSHLPLDSVCLAYKMQVLVYLLDNFRECCDKALVFSHSIPTLDYVESILRSSNRNYVRLDGKTKMTERQQLTKDFNSKDTDICLISTEAGGTGLNLYGANRVIILDEHYNPSWEQQAVGRSYRIGQQKHVYIYRLTVGGTFEVVIQNQALFKQQLASRVVDKKNPKRHALRLNGEYLRPPAHVEQEDLAEFIGKDPLGLDRILAEPDKASCIRAIKLSETFEQEDSVELTAEDQVDLERIRQNEQLRLGDPAGYKAMMANRQAALLKCVNSAMVKSSYASIPNSTPAPGRTQQLSAYPSKGLLSHPQPQALSTGFTGLALSNEHPGSGPFLNRHMMTPVLASNTRVRASTASLSPEKELPSTPAARNENLYPGKEQSTSQSGALVQDRTEPLMRSNSSVTSSITGSQQRCERPGRAATEQVVMMNTDIDKSSLSRQASSTGYDFSKPSSSSATQIASINEFSIDDFNVIQSQQTIRGDVQPRKSKGTQHNPITGKRGLSDDDTSVQKRLKEVVEAEKNQDSRNEVSQTTDLNVTDTGIVTGQGLANVEKISHAATEKASLKKENLKAKSLSQQAIDTAPTAQGEGGEPRQENRLQEVRVLVLSRDNSLEPVTGLDIVRCVPEGGISVDDLTRIFCKRIKTTDQRDNFINLIQFYCDPDVKRKMLVLKKPRSVTLQ